MIQNKSTCQVCFITPLNSYHFHQFIRCSTCKLQCHKGCYYPSFQRGMKFTCDTCQYNLQHQEQQNICFICGNEGLLKKVNSKDMFAHPVCLLFSQNCVVTSYKKLNFSLFKKEIKRKNITCQLCSKPNSHEKCFYFSQQKNSKSSCSNHVHMYCLWKNFQNPTDQDWNFNTIVQELSYKNHYAKKMYDYLKGSNQLLLKPLQLIQFKPGPYRIRQFQIACSDHINNVFQCCIQQKYFCQVQIDQIQCDQCFRWYHKDCVQKKLLPKKSQNSFICGPCYDFKKLISSMNQHQKQQQFYLDRFPRLNICQLIFIASKYEDKRYKLTPNQQKFLFNMPIQPSILYIQTLLTRNFNKIMNKLKFSQIFLIQIKTRMQKKYFKDNFTQKFQPLLQLYTKHKNINELLQERSLNQSEKQSQISQKKSQQTKCQSDAILINKWICLLQKLKDISKIQLHESINDLIKKLDHWLREQKSNLDLSKPNKISYQILSPNQSQRQSSFYQSQKTNIKKSRGRYPRQTNIQTNLQKIETSQNMSSSSSLRRSTRNKISNVNSKSIQQNYISKNNTNIVILTKTKPIQKQKKLKQLQKKNGKLSQKITSVVQKKNKREKRMTEDQIKQQKYQIYESQIESQQNNPHKIKLKQQNSKKIDESKKFLNEYLIQRRQQKLQQKNKNLLSERYSNNFTKKDRVSFRYHTQLQIQQSTQCKLQKIEQNSTKFSNSAQVKIQIKKQQKKQQQGQRLKIKQKLEKQQEDEQLEDGQSELQQSTFFNKNKRSTQKQYEQKSEQQKSSDQQLQSNQKELQFFNEKLNRKIVQKSQNNSKLVFGNLKRQKKEEQSYEQSISGILQFQQRQFKDEHMLFNQSNLQKSNSNINHWVKKIYKKLSTTTANKIKKIKNNLVLTIKSSNEKQNLATLINSIFQSYKTQSHTILISRLKIQWLIKNSQSIISKFASDYKQFFSDPQKIFSKSQQNQQFKSLKQLYLNKKLLEQFIKEIQNFYNSFDSQVRTQYCQRLKKLSSKYNEISSTLNKLSIQKNKQIHQIVRLVKCTSTRQSLKTLITKIQSVIQKPSIKPYSNLLRIQVNKKIKTIQIKQVQLILSNSSIMIGKYEEQLQTSSNINISRDQELKIQQRQRQQILTHEKCLIQKWLKMFNLIFTLSQDIKNNLKSNNIVQQSNFQSSQLSQSSSSGQKSNHIHKQPLQILQQYLQTSQQQIHHTSSLNKIIQNIIIFFYRLDESKIVLDMFHQQAVNIINKLAVKVIMLTIKKNDASTYSWMQDQYTYSTIHYVYKQFGSVFEKYLNGLSTSIGRNNIQTKIYLQQNQQNQNQKLDQQNQQSSQQQAVSQKTQTQGLIQKYRLNIGIFQIDQIYQKSLIQNRQNMFDDYKFTKKLFYQDLQAMIKFYRENKVVCRLKQFQTIKTWLGLYFNILKYFPLKLLVNNLQQQQESSKPSQLLRERSIVRPTFNQFQIIVQCLQKTKFPSQNQFFKNLKLMYEKAKSYDNQIQVLIGKFNLSIEKYDLIRNKYFVNNNFQQQYVDFKEFHYQRRQKQSSILLNFKQFNMIMDRLKSSEVYEYIDFSIEINHFIEQRKEFEKLVEKSENFIKKYLLLDNQQICIATLKRQKNIMVQIFWSILKFPFYYQNLKALYHLILQAIDLINKNQSQNAFKFFKNQQTNIFLIKRTYLQIINKLQASTNKVSKKYIQNQLSKIQKIKNFNRINNLEQIKQLYLKIKNKLDEFNRIEIVLKQANTQIATNKIFTNEEIINIFCSIQMYLQQSIQTQINFKQLKENSTLYFKVLNSSTKKFENPIQLRQIICLAKKILFSFRSKQFCIKVEEMEKGIKKMDKEKDNFDY